MKTGGRCFICDKSFSKAGMTKHLKTHLKDDGNTRLFHIAVEGMYRPEYWLHIEISAGAKLKELDQFLRDIWLECCGHLSAFKIDGAEYYSDTEGFYFEPVKGMDSTLKDVLTPSMEFYHRYDFGTTTELRLKVISERKGKARRKERVKILARNNPPEITCKCGKVAEWVCAICVEENVGEDCYFCDECAEEHECGEEMFLPVVNSPRMGVCGYEGSDKYGD